MAPEAPKIAPVDPRSPAEMAKADVAIGRRPWDTLKVCRCGAHESEHPSICRCGHRAGAHDGRCLAHRCPCDVYRPICSGFVQDPAWMLEDGFRTGHKVYPLRSIPGARVAVLPSRGH